MEQRLGEPATTAVALKHYSSPFSLRGIDLRQRFLLYSTTSAEELTLSRCPEKTPNTGKIPPLPDCSLLLWAQFTFQQDSPSSDRISNPLGSQSIYLISICHFTLRFNDTMLNFIC